jgi:hypothetical protein
VSEAVTQMRWDAPVGSTVCTLCNSPTLVPNRHNLSQSDAKALGPKRCRMCGKGARVRCVLGPGEFWVECAKGHLTRTQP